MVIVLNGVQFGLKSYVWFQNRTSAQREYIYIYFYFTEKPSLGLSREFKLYFSKIFQDYLNIAL